MIGRCIVNQTQEVRDVFIDGLIEYGDEFDSIVDAYVAFRNMMKVTKANGSHHAVDIDLGIKEAMLELMLDVVDHAGFTIGNKRRQGDGKNAKAS